MKILQIIFIGLIFTSCGQNGVITHDNENLTTNKDENHLNQERGDSVGRFEEITLGCETQKLITVNSIWKHDIYTSMDTYPEELRDLDTCEKLISKGSSEPFNHRHISDTSKIKESFFYRRGNYIKYRQPTIVKRYVKDSFNLIVVKDSIEIFDINIDEAPTFLKRIDLYIYKFDEQVEYLNLGYNYEGNFVIYRQFFYWHNSFIERVSIRQDETEISFYKRDKWQLSSDGALTQVEE